MATPLGPPLPSDKPRAAPPSASRCSSSSTEFDLVRLGPPGDILHQLIRFDDGEDPFNRGQPPFYCYQEKEEILPDADEANVADPTGKAAKRPPRAPRASVRWTLEDLSLIHI